MRNYINTALVTVNSSSPGSIDVFTKSGVSRFEQHESGRVDRDTVIKRIFIEKSPLTADADFANGIYGAVVYIEGSVSKVYVGTLADIVWDKNAPKQNFDLPVPVQIPAGSEYKVVIEYHDRTGLANLTTTSASFIVRVEGEEAA